MDQSVCLNNLFAEWLFHCVFKYLWCVFQLTQAQTGKFNVHVHVEYEWRLQNEDLDESDEEMEDKVSGVYLLLL